MRNSWFVLIAVGLAAASLGSATKALASTYSRAVLSDNPAAYYRVNETSGTVAADSSVNAPQNGTYGTVTLGVAGPQPPTFLGMGSENTAAQLAGTDASHFTTTSVTLNSTTYSYETWFNYTAAGLKYLGGRGSGASLAYDAFGLNGNNLFFFNGSFSTASLSTPVTQSTWHQFVFTRNNTAINFYLDGSNVLSTNAAITYTGSRILLGDRPGDIGGIGLNGIVDELSLYNTELTAQQVAAHYLAAFTVPEPSTVLLIGLGGVLLWKRTRRLFS